MPLRQLGAAAFACAFFALAIAPAQALDLVTLDTAFGPITVERSFGDRVVPLLAEIKALGVKAHVKCFAATQGPHVPGSLHLIGEACDVLPVAFKRKGRNRMPTPALMFSRKVGRLIAAAGLRNGCGFRDCGHIDSGRIQAARSHARRRAHARAG